MKCSYASNVLPYILGQQTDTRFIVFRVLALIFMKIHRHDSGMTGILFWATKWRGSPIFSDIINTMFLVLWFKPNMTSEPGAATSFTTHMMSHRFKRIMP